MEAQTSPQQNNPENQPGLSPGDETRDQLYETLEKGDWVMRLHAAGTLLELEDRRGWFFLANAIQHADKDIRGAAVEVLAEHGGMAAVNLLENALKDKDPEVRMTAANALQTIAEKSPKNDSTTAGLSFELKERLESLPATPPEVEKMLNQMELIFGSIGIGMTLLALAMLILGLTQYRIPFILLVVMAAAGFIGNHGVERRGLKGYVLAIAGSLLLLPGVPIFTVPGVLFLIRLLKPEVAKAFEPHILPG